MVTLLVCPECKQKLEAEVAKQNQDLVQEAQLRCPSCEESYEVYNGIPNLIPTSISDNKHWELWRQHLDGFAARRESRQGSGLKMPHPKASTTHAAFFEFSKIKGGTVLDIGCGPGKLRHYLNEKETDYIGLDPLPMDESRDFRFVHALGEYIPFQDNTFSHMLVISALDHFKNLPLFFGEAKRVLKKDGRLLILQSTHEVSGPATLVKMLTHLAKDTLDSRATTKEHTDTPKHMNEFTFTSLVEHAKGHFTLADNDSYSKAWYSPQKYFMSFRPS